MRVHVLQHVPFEDLGAIETLLNKKSAKISYTRFWENVSFPSLNDIDLVIILGGNMSANDEFEYPWLCIEKEFIRDLIDRKIAILGICLGAQLITNALGGSVYKNAHKEIGWWSVEASSASKEAFQFPDKFIAFQWHGETFDLPANATLLASSIACKNQAFQINKNVIGLQFHLEVKEENVVKLLKFCEKELEMGEYIQDRGELLSMDEITYQNNILLMENILNYITMR